MALEPGTRLGPYEVRALLGAGGMGEVYQGWDTRLDRLVAIKILPAHLAERPDLRERFEREAKATANLKHPNICVLYDVGRQEIEEESEARSQNPSPDREGGGPEEKQVLRSAQDDQRREAGKRTVHFLVMEYLEGETLSARLKRGPLPLEQVFQFAAEISDALDKAHRQGYTHRDIKPGNIMLVPTTTLPSTPLRTGGAGPQSTSGAKTATKLLDFGLAKFKQEIVKATLPASEMPTVPGTLTEHGTLLGTLHYMAPEQVESKDVDGRADLFAFGAVVYEMATGKKAFDGESQASVIAKILEVEPPPMSSLDQPGQLSPPALDRVVKKCLRKDREDRWQSARDVTDELKWIKNGGGQAAATVAEAKPPAKAWQRAMPVSMAALIAVVLVVAAGIATWTLKPSGPRSIARVVVSSPPGDQLGSRSDEPVLALSPDGSQIVYVAARSGVPQLYLRPLDSFEAKPLPGTEGATSPFFSPDGQWVGFFAEQKIKKVSVNGGTPQVISESLGGPNSASWGSNDTIFYTPRGGQGVWQVLASGDTPKVLTTLDPQKGEFRHFSPHVLPDGKTILFTVTTGTSSEPTQIVAQSLATGERRVLVQGGDSAHYIPTGHLVYMRAGTLMAAPFDLARLQMVGAPVAIVEGVMQDSSGAGQFSVSAAGTLAYIPGSVQAEPQHRFVWVDRKGVVQSLPTPPRAYWHFSLSRDGQRLAVAISEGAKSDIWVYDILRNTFNRLTFEGNNRFPIWTPDGDRIAFVSTKAGVQSVFWKRADGSGAEEQITQSEYPTTTNAWSPDGKILAYTENRPTVSSDLWVLPFDGERRPRLFYGTPATEISATFSPDGRWLVYISNESGRNEVYVQPFPGPGGKWQISTEGGMEPIWSANGRELFYRNGAKMMAVEITTQPTFTASTPMLLFEGEFGGPTIPIAMYGVTPDGARFLMIQAVEPEQPATQINVVLNWFEELKRRVPAGQ